jgi:hypothetical protein
VLKGRDPQLEKGVEMLLEENPQRSAAAAGGTAPHP